jgi:hypothetical protein
MEKGEPRLALFMPWSAASERGWSYYQINFKANWITRPSDALRIRPKLPEVTVEEGLSKLTWLKALKNSDRNCTE